MIFTDFYNYRTEYKWQTTVDKMNSNGAVESCWIAVQENLALSAPQVLTTIKFQPILSKSNSNFENIDDIWYIYDIWIPHISGFIHGSQREKKWNGFVDESKEEGW